ncbi:MAG: 5-formyltetrahydrofolate cyclo-ligase [Thermoplasmata archaeon]|nr:5-formyltetrahydrofolate cyclo-ligase [Thermoplasmata archaeon]
MMDKKEIREWMWDKLEKEGISRFPGARGRIPNFVGAEKASRRLEKLSAWKKAEVVKINPDSPQKEARYMALSSGKILIMPTPRLREGFLILEPDKIRPEVYREASSIRGAFRYGRKIPIDAIPEVDVVIIGSVCVDHRGNRIGKGGGYAELEYSILLETGRLDESTPVITTIHDVQFVDFEIPRDEFDLGVDMVVTPTRTVRIDNPTKPKGIVWEKLPREKMEEIPVLMELFSRRRSK